MEKKYQSNKKLTPNSQILRKNMTLPERILWYQVLKKLPFTVNRQKVIGNYIVDFCCYSQKVIIEIDGGQHYEETAIEYDKKRTEYLESLGYRVVRYTNLDILQNIQGVYEDLMRKLDLMDE